MRSVRDLIVKMTLTEQAVLVVVLLLTQQTITSTNCAPNVNNDDSIFYLAQIDSVLDYVKGIDRVDFTFHKLLHAEEKDDLTYLDLEVVKHCPPEQTVCLTHLLRCLAQVRYNPSTRSYHTEPNIYCDENVSHDEQETTTASTTTTTAQTATEEKEVEEEIIVKTKSTDCMGCIIELNKNVEGSQMLVDTAMSHIKSERDQIHVPIKILKIERQVVSGVKYSLLLEIAPTICSVNYIVQNCPVAENHEPEICRVVFLEKPWINKEKHIISNNCTVSQDFAPLKQVPNDLDNEIDINNDYRDPQPENYDENVSDKKPNFDKMAESGNIDEEAARLAELEEQIVSSADVQSKKSLNVNVEASRPTEDYSDSGVEEVPIIRTTNTANVNSDADRTRQELLKIILEGYHEVLGSDPYFWEMFSRWTPAGLTGRYKRSSGKNANTAIPGVGIPGAPVPADDVSDLIKSTLLQLDEKSPHQHKYKIKQIKKATKQVVSGFAYEILAEIILSDCVKSANTDSDLCGEHPSKVEKVCEIKIWDQPWLPQGRKTDVKCGSEAYKFRSRRSVIDDDSKSNESEETHAKKKNEDSKSSESSEEVTEATRVKREVLVGAPKNIDVDDSELQTMLKSTLTSLDKETDHETKYKILKIQEATKQLVSGTLIKITADIILSDCPKASDKDISLCGIHPTKLTKTCNIKIWDRPWLPEARQTDVKCGSESFKFRSRRSVVDDDSKSSESDETHEKKKKIENNKSSESSEEIGTTEATRVKREKIVGAPVSKDVNDAEIESLAKSTLIYFDKKTTHDTKFKVLKIQNASSQIVSGVLFRITADIVLTDCPKTSDKDSSLCGVHPTNLKETCEIKIWDQPWLPQGRKTDIKCGSQSYSFRTRRSVIDNDSKSDESDESHETDTKSHKLRSRRTVQDQSIESNLPNRIFEELRPGVDSKRALIEDFDGESNFLSEKNLDIRKRSADDDDSASSSEEQENDKKKNEKKASSDYKKKVAKKDEDDSVSSLSSEDTNDRKKRAVTDRNNDDSSSSSSSSDDDDNNNHEKKAPSKKASYKEDKKKDDKNDSSSSSSSSDDDNDNGNQRHKRNLDEHDEKALVARLAKIAAENLNDANNKNQVLEILRVNKIELEGAVYHFSARLGVGHCSGIESCLIDEEKLCKFKVHVSKNLKNVRVLQTHCHKIEKDSDKNRTNRRDKRQPTDKKMLTHIEQFKNFVKEHKKVYKSYTDFQLRLKIFLKNMKTVETLNREEQGTAVYGATKFADMTRKEFEQYLGYREDLRHENDILYSNAVIPDIELPEAVDWREKKVVTHVKDQKQCGSCWAFSVTGNVEGQYALKHGKLLELSEQELVDCDKYDSGCNGGLMDNAYRAIEEMGGLETEDDYPYHANDEKCHFNKSIARVQLSGALNISQDETDMAKWLTQNGPMAIALNANAMQFYMGGVSHPMKFLCSPTALDHGVLIVGFGTHSKYSNTYPKFNKTLPYWIIKNSWGPKWGEQGYYRIYRGDGSCGVNQMVSSAIVE